MNSVFTAHLIPKNPGISGLKKMPGFWDPMINSLLVTSFSFFTACCYVFGKNLSGMTLRLAYV